MRAKHFCWDYNFSNLCVCARECVCVCVCTNDFFEALYLLLNEDIRASSLPSWLKGKNFVAEREKFLNGQQQQQQQRLQQHQPITFITFTGGKKYFAKPVFENLF